ncbi:ribosomal protein S23 [Fusarium solani]
MAGGKPRGLNAARKLRTNRKDQKWADLAYKKRALGTAFKSSPFGGSSHAKGIVLEKVGVEAKQPNSAIRKCVRVQLIKNGKKVTAFVPNDGCLNFVDENDEVLLAGFGRKGKAKGDIPRCAIQGRQGLWCWSARSVEGEEGEAPFLSAMPGEGNKVTFRQRSLFGLLASALLVRVLVLGDEV